MLQLCFRCFNINCDKKIYKKRWPLRVTLCGKRTKRSERAKNPPKLDSNEGDTQEDSSGKKRSRSSSDADTPSKKRVRKPSNGDNAAKRIKLKVSIHVFCICHYNLIVIELCIHLIHSLSMIHVMIRTLNLNRFLLIFFI